MGITYQDCFPNGKIPNSYYHIILSFGYTIVDDKHEDDYQGDSIYILEDNGKFGWLTFGWGSCSGCDAFEACRDDGDYEGLWNNLRDGIIWKDNAKDFLEFLEKRDWATQPLERDFFEDFVTQAKENLRRDLFKQDFNEKLEE